MAGSDQNARVAGVVAPLLAPLGLALEEVVVTPAGKRRLVRISVDRDTEALPADDTNSVVPPLSLDEVADATRVISAAMDDAEPFGDTPYVLEVTSPGVHRPLTQPRHYRRNVGRLLDLTLADGTAVAGRLLAAAPDVLTLATATGERRIAPGDVAKGRVQVEFTHPDGTGAGPAELADEDLADEDLADDMVAGGDEDMADAEYDDAAEDEEI